MRAETSRARIPRPIYVRQNRVDPNYNRINIVDAGLNSWYNALAVQLNKRFSHGLTGNIAYTWSHAIDEGQGGAGTPNIFASGGPQTYLPGNYRAEKGSSALDVRHRSSCERSLDSDLPSQSVLDGTLPGERMATLGARHLPVFAPDNANRDDLVGAHSDWLHPG